VRDVAAAAESSPEAVREAWRLLEPGCHPQTLLVWAVNGTLLWGSIVLLLSAIAHRYTLPSRLEGSAESYDAWLSRWCSVLFLNLCYSLLLVDAIKIVCLTFTSSAAVDQLEALATRDIEGAKRWKWLRVLRKPLRRAHILMDTLF